MTKDRKKKKEEEEVMPASQFGNKGWTIEIERIPQSPIHPKIADQNTFSRITVTDVPSAYKREPRSQPQSPDSLTSSSVTH